MSLTKHELENALKSALKKYQGYYCGEQQIPIKSIKEIDFQNERLYPSGTTTSNLANCTGGSCRVIAVITVYKEIVTDSDTPQQDDYEIPNVRFEITDDNVKITNDRLTIQPR